MERYLIPLQNRSWMSGLVVPGLALAVLVFLPAGATAQQTDKDPVVMHGVTDDGRPFEVRMSEMSRALNAAMFEQADSEDEDSTSAPEANVGSAPDSGSGKKGKLRSFAEAKARRAAADSAEAKKNAAAQSDGGQTDAADKPKPKD